MLNIWRMDWWAMLRAAMLIAAVAIFSFPQLSGVHEGPDSDVHASDIAHDKGNPALDLLHAAEGDCHSGLECPVQAVFGSRHDAQNHPADLRLTFQFVDISLAGLTPAFDPPPPRLPS